MEQKFGKKAYKQEQKPDKNALYRVWMLVGTSESNIEKRTHYSFYNRNNPKKALDSIKTIHKRIANTGYMWLIDNQTQNLLEVWDNHWRPPNEGEILIFQENRF